MLYFKLLYFIFSFFFFFFNDTATTEIYTLSLHDALPICDRRDPPSDRRQSAVRDRASQGADRREPRRRRSEEHTSELQSQSNLVCRLLLEKKNKKANKEFIHILIIFTYCQLTTTTT